ncbi:MAG: hypothetical protein AAFQ94_00195 [Bacteroidota bacterium]
MKAKCYKTEQEEKKYARERTESHNDQLAQINDHRPNSTIQRKLLDRMNGTSKFDRIVAKMGLQYGVDTSGLKATHNSSLPSRLHAEATIQGNRIHFGPGQDSPHNIRHEVAHAIDNRMNGTPAGDKFVNGYLVDTTREKVVGNMVNNSGSPQLPANSIKPLQVNGFYGQSSVVQRKVKVDKEELNETEISKHLDLTGENQKLFSTHIYPAYDQVGKSFGNLEELSGRMEKVLPEYFGLFRSSKGKICDFIGHQIVFQKLVRSNQKDFEFLLTTAGYEHEFADMINSPLNGVSHLEISESMEKMPLTKLPFTLETDAMNALELVTPPFLLPASKGRPLPYWETANEIDVLFQKALHSLIEKPTDHTILGLIGGFKTNFGLNFTLNPVEIKSEHLSHNTNIDKVRGFISADQLIIDKDSLSEIRIGESKKIAGFSKGLGNKGKNNDHLENGVLSQINFAADMETIALFDQMKSNLSHAVITKRFVETEELLAKLIRLNYHSPKLISVHQQVIRKLANSLIIDDLSNLKQAQLKLYQAIKDSKTKSSSFAFTILKATVKMHAEFISKVKNPGVLWIKDHVASMALVLNKVELKALISSLKEGLTKISGDTQLFNEIEMDGKQDKHKRLVRDIDTLILNLIDVLNNGKNRVANRKPTTNHLYDHDDTLVGARQATYLDQANVQLPALWPDMRLHVAEVREGNVGKILKAVN